MLGLELAEPGGLVVGQQVAQEAPRHSPVPPRVPPPRVRLLVSRREPFRSVFAGRAGQPVPAARTVGRPVSKAVRPHDDRLVNQAGQHVADPVGRHQRAGRHVPRRREVERPGEDRQARPERPLGLRAQPERPVDRRSQRLMPRHRAAPRAGQHRERGVKAIGQLRQRQRPHPDGRELEPERQAVEPPADPDHVRQLRGGDREPARRGGGAGREQLDRAARGRVAAGLRHRQRAEPQDLLARQVQRLPAGGQDRDPVGLQQQLRGEPGDGGGEMLAGVEDQQQPLAPQVIEDGGAGRAGIAPVQPEALGHRHRQQGRVGQAGELDQAGAVGVAVGRVGRRPQRQPGLADAAGTGHGDVPPAPQQAGQRRELVRPPDERGELGRELPPSAPGVNARRSRRIHRHLTRLAIFTLHYPSAAPFSRS